MKPTHHTLPPSLQAEIQSPEHMYDATFASRRCTQTHQKRLNPARQGCGVTDRQHSPARQAIEAASLDVSTEVKMDTPHLI